MRLWSSFLIAFSMYSRIPMPKADWKPENMRYSMCFFPLIGAVCGAFLAVWVMVCSVFSIGTILFSAVTSLIGIFITGGIHLDGFCDTIDALSSHRGKEEKLAILKDSHIGAFAVMGCVCYLLLSFGLWTELKVEFSSVLVIAVEFIVSRALSGLSVVCFPRAKTSGTLSAFSEASEKRKVVWCLSVYLVFCSVLVLGVAPILGLVALFTSLVVFLCYRQISLRQFGGITGDLAGWFLQICEFSALAAMVFAQKVLEMIFS